MKPCFFKLGSLFFFDNFGELYLYFKIIYVFFLKFMNKLERLDPFEHNSKKKWVYKLELNGRTANYLKVN